MSRDPGMRIAMVSANFHPFVGGAERQALELSKALGALGAGVRVLTRHRVGLAEDDVVEGVAVKRLWSPSSGICGSFGFMIAAFDWLWSHGDEWDAAHVHLAGSQALAAALAGKLLMRPVFVKVGGGRGIGELAASSRTILGRMKLEALARLQPRFVAVTRDLASELEEHGLGPPAAVIPNGVDLERFKPAGDDEKAALRRSLGWPEKGFFFLYVGRLAVEKRLALFLREFSEVLRGAGGDIFFAIAGAGPEQPRLERCAQEAGIAGRVLFQPPEASVERFYQASDAFVLPSVSEGLSNALLEAMSCGLPALASRVGGTAEAVQDGVSGILFEPEDGAGMNRAIRRLLGSPSDAEAMGRRARETAQSRYDLRQVARRYLELYLSGGVQRAVARSAKGGGRDR